ncbi:hypothetical protein C8Q75DRAFT_807312 [Abortiporus biennis]|nr:hypothetical protein C8Q75DRAFT_807312 [Abortiporus biennis]
MSNNSGTILSAAHADSSNFATRIDLKNISESEARKLMSAEHKALGYRPPPGSLAAEAQAAAAKHQNATDSGTISAELLRLAAIQDAERIKKERSIKGVDLSAVGEDEARKLVSEEHKALGYRPPPGSLAAQAQAAAARHPNGSIATNFNTQALQRAVLEDVAGIDGAAAKIDLNKIGIAEARKLMSEEHKALGYRPPPGSLAAEAQAAAAKHPHAKANVDFTTLTKAALEDAKKIETQRRSSGGSSPSGTPSVDLNTITTIEIREFEEQKTLAIRPSSEPPSSHPHSIVDTTAEILVTQAMAASVRSDEHKNPESGYIDVAAHIVDRNENDGGEGTAAEAGL